MTKSLLVEKITKSQVMKNLSRFLYDNINIDHFYILTMRNREIDIWIKWITRYNCF